MLPLVLAQTSPGQQTLNAIINPDYAATALIDLAQQYGIQTTLTHIGLALLALFALLELYNLWIRSDAGGLVVLGIKVIIVNYLITSTSFTSLILTVYGYFAKAGEYIIASEVQTDLNKIWTIDKLFTGVGQSWTWGLTHFIPMLFGDMLMLVYLLLAAIMFALYVFAVILSRTFIALSILLIPIIFPLAIWGLISHTYIGKWVSTTIHAALLPLIAALALIMGLKLGALAPLQSISNCITQNPQAWTCIGVASGALVGGVISSIAAIFLMFGLDGIVRSFVGGTEISAAGVMAFRMAAGMVTGGVGRRMAAASGRRNQRLPRRPSGR